MGAGLTIGMSIEIISDYRANPTELILTEQRNETINLPAAPCLCLSMVHLYGTSLWYAQLYDADIYEGDLHGFRPEREYVESDFRLSAILANRTLSRAYFGRTKKVPVPWPMSVLKTLDYYFAMNTAIERDQQPLAATSHFRAVELLVNFTWPSDDEKWALVHRMYDERDLMVDRTQTPYQDAVDGYFMGENVDKVKDWIMNGSIDLIPPPSWLLLSLTCLNRASKVQEYGREGLVDVIWNPNLSPLFTC